LGNTITAYVVELPKDYTDKAFTDAALDVKMSRMGFSSITPVFKLEDI
jgi:hypothetical protein